LNHKKCIFAAQFNLHKQMPAKIRLQRHGKKGKAFYHIVIADGRAPRDGKFIEKIGTYNPNTNPATIELQFETALQWLKNGAQPTETARAILSYKGVLMKLHLDKGVVKGALTEEQAEAKLVKWLEEKNSKIENKRTSLTTSMSDLQKKRKADELAKNAARAAAIAAKNAPEPEPVAEVVEEEIPAAEAEAPVEETPVVEAEAPAEEVAAPVEETPVVEAEAPAEEVAAPSEEAPAAEDENKTAE
jgi:small subunit ribosomal protein S16